MASVLNVVIVFGLLMMFTVAASEDELLTASASNNGRSLNQTDEDTISGLHQSCNDLKAIASENPVMAPLLVPAAILLKAVEIYLDKPSYETFFFMQEVSEEMGSNLLPSSNYPASIQVPVAVFTQLEAVIALLRVLLGGLTGLLAAIVFLVIEILLAVLALLIGI